MKVTFFNANPPGTIVAPDAFRKAIGQKVPIRNTNTGEVGEGILLDVQVVDGGIEVTYETDMNLGVSINFPMRVEKLTARMMFPYLSDVAQRNEYKFCEQLGKALDHIDTLMQEKELLMKAQVKLIEEAEANERRWDEHFCHENVVPHD